MPTHWIIIIASSAASGAVAAVLRTWIVESFRTRRLTTALKDTRPGQRPPIILACSRLERDGDEKPPTDVLRLDDNDPHRPRPQTP
ncbi:hypothetical protein PV458_44020 [Streptomyces sp. MN03-5084-2B]|nr:hypothetical protein [Streptomyces sp. MN03-5084-2B]